MWMSKSIIMNPISFYFQRGTADAEIKVTSVGKQRFSFAKFEVG